MRLRREQKKNKRGMRKMKVKFQNIKENDFVPMPKMTDEELR